MLRASRTALSRIAAHFERRAKIKNMKKETLLHNDLSGLQGSWLQIGYERDGLIEPIDDEKNWQPVTHISGKTFTVTIADGSTVLNGVFNIDPTQYPKTIDWIDIAGPIASDRTILAIYRLTEREFEFCAAYDGALRPKVFSTAPGLVIRRMRRL
jgi:uncharacterized protein (TIGR03067 family)